MEEVYVNSAKFKGVIMTSIALLMILASLGNSVGAATGTKVLIDLSHFNTHDVDFGGFVGNLTDWGFEVVLATGGINATILADVDIFVETMPLLNFTADETTALSDWFAGGNKAMWLATDSDFTTAEAINGPIYQNALLETVGAKLRFEPSSVESPDVNIEAPYRVLAPIFNRAPGVASALTANVRTGFFHGPSILCGWNGTDYVDLETAAPENVTWIGKTSGSSVLVETDPTYLAYAHTEGQNGPFVIMAAEEVGTNKIVLTGEAIFTVYKRMFGYPGEYDYPHDDKILVKNVFNWFAVETLYNTELEVSDVPTLVGQEGEDVTFKANYTASGILAENLTIVVLSVPVENASVSISIDGTSITADEIAPGEYTGNWTSMLGTYTWTVNAAKDGYQMITTSEGEVEVIPEFQSLATILILMLIVATATIVAKKRRLIRPA
jgi:hypothetical protein